MTALRRRNKKGRTKFIVISFLVLLALLVIIGGLSALSRRRNEKGILAQKNIPEWIDVQLIDVDGAARRGTAIDAINNIVIHYVGNPASSAQGNRDYFNTKGISVSSHFVVGLEGEVIQCVPLDEKSSASNNRNSDTISIEVCHPDESGQFSDVTYKSLIRLSAWLCEAYGLSGEDLIRHYDITGKICPKYYVEHEDAWETLKADVDEYISENHNYYTED